MQSVIMQSVIILSQYCDCCYATLVSKQGIIIPMVIMLSVVVQSVVMLSAILLSVI